MKFTTITTDMRETTEDDECGEDAHDAIFLFPVMEV